MGSEQSFDGHEVGPVLVVDVTDVLEVSLVLEVVSLVLVVDFDVLECVDVPPEPPALSGRSYV